MSAYASLLFSNIGGPEDVGNNHGRSTRSDEVTDEGGRDGGSGSKSLDDNVEKRLLNDEGGSCECELAAMINSADVDTRQWLIRMGASKPCKNPDAYAVRFKLTISSSGRQYTCVRSLLKFVELRDRLMKELRMKSSEIQIPELPTMPNITIPSPNEGLSYIFDESRNECTIPVSARLSTTSGGWGFAVMQKMVGGRIAVMNEWLSQICAVMPRSPSLLTFLWESTSSDHLETIVEETVEEQESNKINFEETIDD